MINFQLKAKIVPVNLCTSSNFTYNASSNEVYLRFYKNKIKPETRFRVIWQGKYKNRFF